MKYSVNVLVHHDRIAIEAGKRRIFHSPTVIDHLSLEPKVADPAKTNENEQLCRILNASVNIARSSNTK
jgi:hypothetical protein